MCTLVTDSGQKTKSLIAVLRQATNCNNINQSFAIFVGDYLKLMGYSHIHL